MKITLNIQNSQDQDLNISLKNDLSIFQNAYSYTGQAFQYENNNKAVFS